MKLNLQCLLLTIQAYNIQLLAQKTFSIRKTRCVILYDIQGSWDRIGMLHIIYIIE